MVKLGRRLPRVAETNAPQHRRLCIGVLQSRSGAVSTVALLFVIASLLIVAPAAVAEDGLPPGVPIPTWAVGKQIHFYPVPSRRQEVAEYEAAQRRPLVEGFGESYCYNDDKLCYWGGAVQHEPQLYLIFWGEDFQTGPPATLELTAQPSPSTGTARHGRSRPHRRKGTTPIW